MTDLAALRLRVNETCEAFTAACIAHGYADQDAAFVDRRAWPEPLTKAWRAWADALNEQDHAHEGLRFLGKDW